jgi:cytoskeletal protein RodZ
MKKLFDTNEKRIIWTCIFAAVLITVFFCIRGCSSNTAEVQTTSTPSMSPSAKAIAIASASASPSAAASASATATASATEAAAEQPSDTETSEQTAAESQPVQQETPQQEPAQQQTVPVQQESTPAPATPEPAAPTCSPTTKEVYVEDTPAVAAYDETAEAEICNTCGKYYTGDDADTKIASHIASAHDWEGGYHLGTVVIAHHDAVPATGHMETITSGC